MADLYCKNKCCWLAISKIRKTEPIFHVKQCMRAGFVIIDKFNRILITQSYNNFWGFPKGTVEQNESLLETSIRETYEETGIRFNPNIISKSRRIFLKRERIFFFYTKLSTIGPATVDPTFLESESTGCGWINPKCLKFLLKNKKLKLNFVTKAILNTVFNHDWSEAVKTVGFTISTKE